MVKGVYPLINAPNGILVYKFMLRYGEIPILANKGSKWHFVI